MDTIIKRLSQFYRHLEGIKEYRPTNIVHSANLHNKITSLWYKHDKQVIETFKIPETEPHDKKLIRLMIQEDAQSTVDYFPSKFKKVLS